MKPADDDIQNFIKVASNTLSGNSNSNSNSNYKEEDFETKLGKYGKELDESFNNSYQFLFDNVGNSNSTSGSPYSTINEINLVFNKSKLLFSPSQFAYIQANNKVYIENPTLENWLQFNVDNIEEGLINLKDKNKRDETDRVHYLTSVTEKIPRR